ncbi:hypothetical protein LSAT2_032325 [Lamellibrachia satsuma]|nr:hypothetical protein LSAT2_032325 [Lamellibrachia satsuma]
MYVYIMYMYIMYVYIMYVYIMYVYIMFVYIMFVYIMYVYIMYVYIILGHVLSPPGVSTYLKEQNPNVKAFLVDPPGSMLYNYFKHGKLEPSEGRGIAEGVGQARITKNLEGAPIDDALYVADQDIVNTSLQLLNEDGLFVGGSSGMNVSAACKVAEMMGPGHTIVTALCDSGQPKARLDRKRYPNDPKCTRLFNETEIEAGISKLKNSKATGLDDIQTEFIKHFGPKARDWLLCFFNNCVNSNKIPKLWHKAKKIALLKPEKDPSEAKSFRPISLLCHTYKLFERLILNRLAEHLYSKIIPEQAAFHPEKLCMGQLLNVTEHIEDGFKEN